MTSAIMEEAPPAPEEVDPDAPYGRKPDGTPYKRSPEHRAGLAAALGRRASNKVPSAPPARASKSASSRGANGRNEDQYKRGVLGLLQIPAFALGVAARVKPVLGLDATALTIHGPGLATAIAQTAMDDERFAAILDRVLAVGPYGALLGAMVPLAMQIACNHGAIPPTPELGVLSPAELLRAAGVETPPAAAP